VEGREMRVENGMINQKQETRNPSTPKS